ncbi:MAG: preprotein translocase subunit SecG [Candidatus Buchananbacteria bacterium]
MKTQLILDLIQLVSAVALVTLVLMQNRGAGVGSAFGGDGNVYRTKRGVEKYLFVLTIVFAAIFLVVSLVNVIL